MAGKNTHTVQEAVGHDAIRIIRNFGLGRGGEMLRVIALTYLRALAAVIGWPEALRLIQENFAADYVPPRGRNLTLVSRAHGEGRQ